ncbi:hypothetical protein KY366_06005 [Candidatus Woesearchaeota archaeon]|nr:hypothetical protein [Candidatus Woesearchaeota archaeon]
MLDIVFIEDIYKVIDVSTTGMGVLTNKRFEINEHISLDYGDGYLLTGEVRRRIGDKTPDGYLKLDGVLSEMKLRQLEELRELKDLKEQQYITLLTALYVAKYRNLEDYFGDLAEGFDYFVGVKLDERLPEDLYRRIMKTSIKKEEKKEKVIKKPPQIYIGHPRPNVRFRKKHQ